MLLFFIVNCLWRLLAAFYGYKIESDYRKQKRYVVNQNLLLCFLWNKKKRKRND
jgi:hypothetical protein